MWGITKFILCILFLSCCCTVAQGQMPVDCCLRVKNKPIHKSAIANYHLQISGQGCAIDAMILVTRGGMKLCMPADVAWVKEVVEHVNLLRERCKKANYKGKRCAGVRPE